MLRKSLFICFIFFFIGFVSAGNVIVKDGKIYSENDFLIKENETILNVNSTNWWSGLTGWVNGWLINEGNNLTFDETKLNSTIENKILVSNVSLWNKSGNNIYYNNGNVGVGTMNPQNKLNVVGDLNVTGNIYGVSNSHLLKTGDTASGNYNFDSGTFFIDATNNNLGIGKSTPNPNYRVDMTTKSSSWGAGFNIKDSTDTNSIFHVSESGSKIGAMRLYNNGVEKVFINAGGTSTFANGVTASFFNTNGYVQAGAEGYFGDGYVINGYDYLGNGDWGIYDGSSDGTIATFDGNTYYYGNRLIRVYNDNVGIGTSSPTAKLDVFGGIEIDGTSGGCLMIRDTDNLGWTKCTTLNGVMSCSIDADGIC